MTLEVIRQLSDLWRLREVIKEISKSYYDSHPLLFSEDECTLREQICGLEEQVRCYNSWQRKNKARYLLDLEALRPSIRTQVLKEVRRRVAQAQSTTLEDFGNWRQLRK